MDKNNKKKLMDFIENRTLSEENYKRLYEMAIYLWLKKEK